MQQAIWSTADGYESFNAFFTRKLNPDARQWDKKSDTIVSPVDGAISQIGNINNSEIIQAKGKQFSLNSLLANDTDSIIRLNNGTFATLYLSPKDYHRIHMPFSGQLIKSIYVPGDLFPVNNASVNTIDQLFARNERFISLFETELGLMAQIMVGATCVGSMSTVWAGQITPTQTREITTNDYEEEEILLNKNEEFGHFNMGSTVIIIFEQDKISWLDGLKANDAIVVGQKIGEIN